MHTSRFVYFLLFAAASQAHAGAGQTSAGVTTTVPNDPTAATQDVQSQSSNFAQQNQAIAASNGATGTTGTTGTITPIGTAGAARPGSAIDANGRPVDPNNPSADPKAANQKPVAPAAPPAPPPEYVSNIKKVDRTAVAAVQAPVAVTADKKPSDTAKDAPPADIDPSVVTAPGVQRQTAAQKTMPRPAAEPGERTGAERVAPGTGSSGGSGAPPDSFAFYIGLIIAGALLAFAAAMFLRAEKGGAR